jgi:membrane protease subunit (stomatin/prohibitin family)
MGLIQAVAGAVGGTLADQWKDFYTVPGWIDRTAAVFPAVQIGTNSKRGSNSRGSEDVITNGTKIIVPEGHVLITLEDGAITAVAAEPGGYIWDSVDRQAKSIFYGGGIVEPIIRQSWQRFKFGGKPGSQQKAVFVNIQELPDNRFGTQSEIYWDDSFLNTQVGAIARGSYTLKIVDPILFLKSFVPSAIVQNGEVFDFTDSGNPQASQLFSEVVSVLAAAFSAYTNESGKENRITRIQRDAIGFAKALSSEVESAFQWKTSRGLEISKAALLAVDYDEATKNLLKTVQRADALSGGRGNSNLQASVAQGIQAAGSTEGAAGILGLGIAAGSIGLSDLQQSTGQTLDTSKLFPSQNQADGLVARLSELKDALSKGLITQEDFDQAKSKLL